MATVASLYNSFNWAHKWGFWPLKMQIEDHGNKVELKTPNYDLAKFLIMVILIGAGNVMIVVMQFKTYGSMNMKAITQIAGFTYIDFVTLTILFGASLTAIIAFYYLMRRRKSDLAKVINDTLQMSHRYKVLPFNTKPSFS